MWFITTNKMTTEERIIRLEAEINTLLKARIADLTQKLQAMTAAMVEKERAEWIMADKDARVRNLENALGERNREVAGLRKETSILQRRVNQLQAEKDEMLEKMVQMGWRI